MLEEWEKSDAEYLIVAQVILMLEKWEKEGCYKWLVAAQVILMLGRKERVMISG